VLLSLVTLAPPARMLASGLLLDSGRLWSAAAAAARSLAADLVRISPALVHSPLLRRLRGASPRPPAGRTGAPAWPHAEGRSFVVRSGRGAVRCEVQVPAAAAARLADRTAVAQAELAPLLRSAPVALALAGAARAYAEKAQKLAGRPVESDDPLRDLRATAARLARHCAELASGELRRSPEVVAAPPPPKAVRAPQPPLSHGRIRRLVYRQGWRAPAEERPGAIWPSPGVVVTVGLHHAVGRDAASGRTLFEEPCRFAVRAWNGDDLFVSGADSLARIDPLTGAARWR